MKCSFVWKNKTDGHRTSARRNRARDSRNRAPAPVRLTNRAIHRQNHATGRFHARPDHRHRETFPKKAIREIDSQRRRKLRLRIQETRAGSLLSAAAALARQIVPALERGAAIRA